VLVLRSGERECRCGLRSGLIVTTRPAYRKIYQNQFTAVEIIISWCPALLAVGFDSIEGF
jgi:hypothetical protein